MNEEFEEEQETPEDEAMDETSVEETNEAEPELEPPSEPEPEDPEPDDPEPEGEDLQAQLAELDDKWRRAVAEMENLRRRTSMQEDKARKFAVSGFAKEMLAVADNLRRALEHVPAEALEADEAIQALYAGVEMTGKSLAQALEKFGVNEVVAQDQIFNPKYHEAMFEIPNPDVPAGTILEVLETGYMIHDRLLRPARVGVAKGGPKPQPTTGEQESPQDEAESQAGRQAYDAEDVEAGSTLDEEI